MRISTAKNKGVKFNEKQQAANTTFQTNTLHKEHGKTLSQLVLKEITDRAAVLLKGTALSVQNIAVILGYSNASDLFVIVTVHYRTYYK